jgi:signal transduction histidine kinase
MMNEMLERLEAVDRQQRRFIADASHELRSPLTTLRMQTELALAHPERTNWAQLAGRLLHETERLSDLVDDLLMSARASSTSNWRNSEVDLDDLLLAEVARLNNRGMARAEVGSLVAARVRGDASELSRLLRNLGDNAQRHASAEVRLSLVVDGRHAVLDVDDDGSGVPAADRERIFDRFTRLDDARAREAGGSGLGLALARELAHAHGGTLHALANSTGGARFRLMLPLERPEPAGQSKNVESAAMTATRS